MASTENKPSWEYDASHDKWGDESEASVTPTFHLSISGGLGDTFVLEFSDGNMTWRDFVHVDELRDMSQWLQRAVDDIYAERGH